MTLTLLLCLLFFFGYLALRSPVQALAFLAIGAGLQLMSYAFPRPESAPETAPDSSAVILVCLFSVLGYVAWRTTRKWLERGPFSRQRLLVFLGWGANGVIFAFILWQTGTISL